MRRERDRRRRTRENPEVRGCVAVTDPQARPEDVARFVPALLLRRQGMPSGPSTPGPPSSDSFPAVVLFADISGFTRLSERMARRGAEGAEALSQVLNAYFGRLIDVITAHGGDVLKFAGDALLACWRLTDPAELPDAVHRAGQCALAVQQALQDVEAPGGERLSLRVGIGAGDMVAASLGGVFGRWELVVMGPAVNEATAAAGGGEPGCVTLG